MDESGKLKNAISLIGSVVVSNNFYYSEKVQKLNKKLINNDVHFHLTAYKKHHLNNYLDLFELFISNKAPLRFNVVSFKRARFKNHILSNKIDDMIYLKIPERTIYGALRGYSSFTEIEADIYIEHANDYAKRKLDNAIKMQLNTHSLYKYDHFKILSSQLVYKNKEIGLEFTDSCLGVLRIIIENKDVRTAEIQNISKNLIYKKQLVHELISRHRDFFEDIVLFELDDKGTLKRIDMYMYINLFESKYHKEQEQFNEIAGLYTLPTKKRKKPRKIPYR